MRHLDAGFASEAIVALFQRYRGTKGFRIVDVADEDLIENIDAAARRVEQPVLADTSSGLRFLGPSPTASLSVVLELALKREQLRAADVAYVLGISTTNASNKLKQLWQRGYLLRREEAAARARPPAYLWSRAS